MVIKYEDLKDNQLTFPVVPYIIHKTHYLDLHCGFDIETTNIISEKYAFMYIWQFAINDNVIIGRTWFQFVQLLERLRRIYTLRETTHIIIWVANLSFEFQFFRKWVNVTNVFAKERRQPLKVVIDDCIEFRDCLAISGGSLSQLAKDYTKTQKLVGDLDYNILRNSHTELTPQELAYCINDVVILSEFSQFIFNTYASNNFIPLTKTGILRRKVKDAVKESGESKKIRNAITLSFPERDFYNILMNWVFRGGYVHANAYATGQIIENVYSVDFTSSYPSVMFKDYMPCSNFYLVDDTSISNYIKLNAEFCTIACIEFHNIKTTLAHSIESKNKIIDYAGATWDNGRLQSAERVCVILTELDYDNYTKFYSWESMKITKLWRAVRGKLPDYFLKILGEEYGKKATLKKNGLSKTKEYAISKSVVNSSFGLTVTRMNESDITYTSDEWGETLENFDYNKEKSKSVLLPQWGVYICAHARHNLLSCVYEIDKNNHIGDVLYNDTDSIKIRNFEKYRDIINKYNEKQTELNKEICAHFGYNFELFNDLGTFEIENHGNAYERFKTLGAKRYITEYKNEYEVTLAGLPKTSITKYIEKENVKRAKQNKTPLDVFEFFDDDMTLDIDDSQKLTTAYNDTETEYNVNGEIMREKSSVCLYSIPFKLSLTKEYKEFCELLIHKLNERKKL